MAGIYPDSKTFVDKKLKYSPGKIIKKFEELLKNNDGEKLTLEQIKQVNLCNKTIIHKKPRFKNNSNSIVLYYNFSMLSVTDNL